ncbi:alkaline phosphatase [Desulfurispirillum indicum]|uniref:alkaline phosphatase n=1 Tax=Desulfurispirillum indicum TaxID=936456 RepID=UPI001CF9DD92|nr:alkaline phosphatase [Desulfurispirillum indicum]UCZ57318.1 alkaline phosphatase [Desulfurispirillum indicum]
MTLVRQQFMKWLVSFLLLALLLTGCGSSSSSSSNDNLPDDENSPSSAKNIILMITDGASFGTWDAAGLFQYGSSTGAVYFEPEFRKYLMTTYAMNTSATPTGGNEQEIGYDPDQAWGLESYNTPAGYIHQNATDSAAAGTAISTGVRTYNNAMNWSNDPAGTGSPLTPTVAELAKQHGKVVGTISSVQWSHATPAAFSDAHNISRNAYADIAGAMLNGDVMDLIMGAGHPQWNDNGVQTISDHLAEALTDGVAQYVGGRESWIHLKEGTHPSGWTLIESKDDFEALSSGDLSRLDNSSRLVGTVQAGSTLQQRRSGYLATDSPEEDAYLTHVPSLATMSLAALNALSALDNGEGIFLQIEGGAVDWAAHARQTSRITEEQIDFNNAVDVVVTWIGENGGWEENLLIITTDHGNAMPMGPSSDTEPHARIALTDVLHGQYVAGTNEQGVRWWSGNHTNELVPLFVRGNGAEWFDDHVVGVDENFTVYYDDWGTAGFDGTYVSNIHIFSVMEQAIVPSE